MRSIEITRAGDRSVADQLAEMRLWLEIAGIRATELEPLKILKGRISFRANFASAADADRFVGEFGDKEPGKTP